MNMLHRNMKDIKKIQMIFSTWNFHVWDLKNTLNGTNKLLDITEEKMSDLEDTAKKIIPNKT